jgi:hypothetical protein
LQISSGVFLQAVDDPVYHDAGEEEHDLISAWLRTKLIIAGLTAIFMISDLALATSYESRPCWPSGQREDNVWVNYS